MITVEQFKTSEFDVYRVRGTEVDLSLLNDGERVSSDGRAEGWFTLLVPKGRKPSIEKAVRDEAAGAHN